MKICVHVVRVNDYGKPYSEDLRNYTADKYPSNGEFLVFENGGPIYKVNSVVNHILPENMYVDIYVLELDDVASKNEILKTNAVCH
jgi:hypothetical protein